MAITAARITGVKAGETVLTEEQIKTGYEGNIVQAHGVNWMYQFAGTAGDSWSAGVDGGPIIVGWIILAQNNGLDIAFSSDNIDYSNQIYVPVNIMIQLDIKKQYFAYKNHTAGKNAVFFINTLRIV